MLSWPDDSDRTRSSVSKDERTLPQPSDDIEHNKPYIFLARKYTHSENIAYFVHASLAFTTILKLLIHQLIKIRWVLQLTINCASDLGLDPCVSKTPPIEIVSWKMVSPGSVKSNREQNVSLGPRVDILGKIRPRPCSPSSLPSFECAGSDQWSWELLGSRWRFASESCQIHFGIQSALSQIAVITQEITPFLSWI